MSEHKNRDSIDEILEALESLRSHLVDLEALANAAVALLEHIPYTPRPVRQRAQQAGGNDDARRNAGRLQAMVIATADAARALLDEVDGLIDRIEGPRPFGNGNGSGSSTAHEPMVPYYTSGKQLLVA